MKSVGIIGLGYVGLPLALEFANKNFLVTGFDIDEKKAVAINNGESYISHISSEEIMKAKNFSATTNMSLLSQMDSIIICVPTPLTKHREPDLQYIEKTSQTISKYLQKEQLVILESTTYPGTTEEVMLPILEKGSGLKAGKDFFLAYSPEREDPNNSKYTTKTIPKVISGLTDTCLQKIKNLYSEIFEQLVCVSSLKVAEATKIVENTYRAVNIAMVNELKMLFDKMDIDVWEVINAAKTKPFGFHAFYPGPGLGGHCIPIDPFYLTWKAREYDVSTRFIELAGEVNTMMPYYVVDKIGEALNKRQKSIYGSNILIIGVAYKKDVNDTRESPALKVFEILNSKQPNKIDYYDPYVPSIHGLRKYPNLNLKSIELSEDKLKSYDCVVLITDHSNVEYDLIYEYSDLIVDTRNVLKDYQNAKKVIKA